MKKTHFVIFGITSALFAITATGFYIFNFKDTSISGNPTDWASLGNYLSGTVTSILSFVSFIALLITINIQNKQQELSNKALLVTERPWVSLELRVGQNIKIVDSKLIVEFEVTVENHGKTPALNLTFGIKLYNNRWGLADTREYIESALNDNAANSTSRSFDALFPSKKETLIVDIPLEINELISSVEDLEFENSFPVFLQMNSYVKYINTIDNDKHITSQDGHIYAKDPEGRQGLAIMIQMLENSAQLKNDKIYYVSGILWHKVYIT